VVSTVKAFDNPRYETAIQHPFYNENELIVVEQYDTEEQATEGHQKWIGIMTADLLPEYLDDVLPGLVGLFTKIVNRGNLRYYKEGLRPVSRN